MKVENNYNAPYYTKIAVLTGTAISSGLYVASLIKRKPGSIPKRISNLEMGIKEGVGLSLASIGGGLTTGLIADKKKERPVKLREGINQVLGNCLVPFASLACVNKLTKAANKYVRAVCAVGTLFTTTFLGHAIADKVNKKIFKEDKKYKVGVKDFATDFDDILFSASTVMNSKPLYKTTALLCPLTYLSLGYMAGTRQTLDKIV